MNRHVTTVTILIAALGLLATTGCGPDPQERIALLEEDNQRLMDDLSLARQDAEQARRDCDLCEQELAAVQASNNDLRSRLASRPEPQEPVPQGWTAVPGGAMIAIESEVLFRSGRAELRPEAQRALDSVVRVINSEYATHDVLVYGHTDDEPIKKSGWKDNFELSAQRALSVVRYLQGRGVNPTRLVAGGCGEHRPVVSNTSSANRTKNRRVEVYALDAAIQTAGR